MNSGNRCPRCEGRLQSWTELNDDEREMVERLPSGGYTLEERQARHRWCPRCWYEDSGGSPTLA